MSSINTDHKSHFNNNIQNILNYFIILTVSFHDLTALFGFFIFLVIMSQLISGTMLAFSLIPEPMIIPIVRDEEDIEDLYVDDFFWLHERGVDLIFIFSYSHLFSKLYLNVFEYEHESAWNSGVFTFLVLQVVVFLGLVLCCTHLSEITLTIATNILHTFFAFNGKVYWWFFTDNQLNTDTIIRMACAHYVSAFFVAYLGLIHGIEMHYDWKNETTFDALDTEMVWWDEALSNELGNMICTIVIISLFIWVMYAEPEALSYEIFMWGDIGMVIDVSFYGVAPHWYFSPFMAWLIACPHHNTGIFGLLLFFVILYYQPTLHGTSSRNNYNRSILLLWSYLLERYGFYSAEYTNLEVNLSHQSTYSMFAISCLYVSSFLPYGSFYNRVNGNLGLLFGYIYIFCYLIFPVLSSPIIMEFIMQFICARAGFIQNFSV